MKTTTLQLAFAAACGIGAGFALQRYFSNRPNNVIVKAASSMGQVVTSAGQVIGVTSPKILSTQTPIITPEEKLALFQTARGYTGGANPPRHILDEFRASAAIAQARIDELGLRAEFEQYLLKISNLPKPV